MAIVIIVIFIACQQEPVYPRTAVKEACDLSLVVNAMRESQSEDGIGVIKAGEVAPVVEKSALAEVAKDLQSHDLASVVDGVRVAVQHIGGGVQIGELAFAPHKALGDITAQVTPHDLSLVVEARNHSVRRSGDIDNSEMASITLCLPHEWGNQT